MLSLDKNPDYARLEKTKVQSKYYDLDINITGTEVWSWEALDQSIENVLCTNKGDRLFNIEFGCPLIEVLFQNNVNIQELVDKAFDIIEAWVPIKINRTKSRVQQEADIHAISFFIYYSSNDMMIQDHCFCRRLRK